MPISRKDKKIMSLSTFKWKFSVVKVIIKSYQIILFFASVKKRKTHIDKKGIFVSLVLVIITTTITFMIFPMITIVFLRAVHAE